MKRFLALAFIICFTLSSALASDVNISLSFTGDCTLGSQENTHDKPNSFVQAITKHGYNYPFANFKAFFEEDDLTIINFEGVLYNKAWNIQPKTYNFRAPVDFAQILNDNSIEVAFLGNNHIMDYGLAGMNSTLKALESHYINYFAILPLHQSTYIYEKDGIKIGFTGVYTGDKYRMRKEFKQSFEHLKEQGCNYIVASLHGGTEYSKKIDFLQENAAKDMIDLGADVVIGHHPHIIQRIEEYKGKYIVYSLGNFAFGGNPNIRAKDAIIARLNISFDNKGKLKSEALNIIPVHPSSDENINNYQPMFAKEEEAKEILKYIEDMSNSKELKLKNRIMFAVTVDEKGFTYGRVYSENK